MRKQRKVAAIIERNESARKTGSPALEISFCTETKTNHPSVNNIFGGANGDAMCFVCIVLYN